MKGSLQILLTNHEEIAHVAVANYLRTLGHQVEVARDGHAALKQINAQHYDLLLVDPHTPDINGIEFLTKV